MKLLWHSVSPLAPTGYGNQTALFADRLARLPDVDLAVSSGFGLLGRAVDWKGVKVYPGADWNANVLMWRERLSGPDRDPVLVVTLMDVWPLDPGVFRHIADQPGGLACWTPVDHSPVPPRVIEFLKATGARPIAMSRFGERELQAAGFEPLYVPHGVDTTVFQPYDRAQAREKSNLPTDRFIVGMVANNEGVAPPRKAFPQALAAFKELHTQHPDALLYLHTEATGVRHGVDIRILADHFDIPDDAIIVTSPTRLEEGVSPGEMAALFSSFDVLLNPSYGEGFGVPIIEAQACGTPVVVTDWTSMPELCGAGWLIDGAPWYDCQHYAWFKSPSIASVTAALESAYEQRGSGDLRAQAREFALAYDADTVTETYWKPALAALTAPREVPPLPNRATRRAAAKQKATA